MVDSRWILFLFTICLGLACQQKSLQDMTISELENHIDDLKYLVDSLEIIRAKKIELDTTGRYSSSFAAISNIDDIFEDKSLVFVKGKIDSSLSIAKFKITQDRPYQSQFAKTISIDNDGAFSDEFEIDQNGFYSLKFNTYEQDIYLENGNTIGILIDSISASGIQFIGDLSHENNFLTSHHNQIQKHDQDQLHIEGSDNQILKEVIEHNSDSIISTYRKEWVTHARDISEGFKELMSHKIELSKSRALLNFAINQDAEYSEEFFSPQQILLDSDTLFHLYDFRKYLFEYFEFKSGQLVSLEPSLDKNDLPYWNQKYNYVDSLFSNKIITEFLKTDVIFESIATLRNTSLNPLIREFQTDVSKQAYLKTINSHYKSILKPFRGTLAPEISGETFAGDEFNVSQYRGKYVYIFIWATWCGPCKIEIPYYKQMLEDYADENIQFIGISVDKSKQKWTESFFYNDYPGLQVLVPGDWKSPLVTDYGVSSIPQFILIDPLGEIVELHAERPTKNIKAQLSQYGIFAKAY